MKFAVYKVEGNVEFPAHRYFITRRIDGRPRFSPNAIFHHPSQTDVRKKMDIRNFLGFPRGQTQLPTVFFLGQFSFLPRLLEYEEENRSSCSRWKLSMEAKLWYRKYIRDGESKFKLRKERGRFWKVIQRMFRSIYNFNINKLVSLLKNFIKIQRERGREKEWTKKEFQRWITKELGHVLE